jgi:hypothetical protein
MRAESGAILARREPLLRSQIWAIFLDLRDILKGLELCAADCYCARFPNRMVDYVANNVAVIEEAYEP